MITGCQLEMQLLHCTPGCLSWQEPYCTLFLYVNYKAYNIFILLSKHMFTHVSAFTAGVPLALGSYHVGISFIVENRL